MHIGMEDAVGGVVVECDDGEMYPWDSSWRWTCLAMWVTRVCLM